MYTPTLDEKIKAVELANRFSDRSRNYLWVMIGDDRIEFTVWVGSLTGAPDIIKTISSFYFDSYFDQIKAVKECLKGAAK